MPGFNKKIINLGEQQKLDSTGFPMGMNLYFSHLARGISLSGATDLDHDCSTSGSLRVFPGAMNHPSPSQSDTYGAYG